MEKKSRKKTSVIWVSVSDEDFAQIVKEAKTYTDILRYFGLENKGGNHNTVKARIAFLDIDDSHIAKGLGSNAGKKFKAKKTPMEDILVNGSTYNRYHLKRRLIEEGFLKYECAKCGMGGTWMGEHIVLILDHINGISNDNRLDNLRLLCPNCNSQTKTFAGRNLPDYVKERAIEKRTCPKCGGYKHCESTVCGQCFPKQRKSKIMPPKDILEKDIESMTWVGVGKKYGVSDNAVRKWARKYDLMK